MKWCTAFLSVVLALPAVSPALAREKETVGGAVVQPLRDLSLMRTKIPPILIKAAEAPYAPSSDCELARQEIADLTTVLGDDISGVNDGGGTLVTSAVKSVVKLPFNGIIRRITGAHKRDQAFEDAMVAGVARRAYLMGALTACPVVPPLVQEVAEAPVSPPPVDSEAAVVAATEP